MDLDPTKQDADVEIVGAFEAKTHLSSFLRKAHAGRRIVVTQRGKPIAQICPLEAAVRPGPTPRKLRGDMKGKIWIAEDFCDEIEDMREYME